ncbi:uncharacterized protein LTR77_004924 [Saxophila tyrrhenica]|uniref:2-dehydropantoate 2-reductase n=1 Tax=Saxophila tyrrhenica TaxID=1690608 RepID=A0AAV9PAJ6_9PEZI|nr:hypothetical protein LTR77_004924 [Saxophila tyrrhenica]
MTDIGIPNLILVSGRLGLHKLLCGHFGRQQAMLWLSSANTSCSHPSHPEWLSLSSITQNNTWAANCADTYTLREQGHSTRHIARITGIPKTTVGNVLRTGRKPPRKENAPKTLSEEDVALLARELPHDWGVQNEKKAKELGIIASRTTICRALKKYRSKHGNATPSQGANILLADAEGVGAVYLYQLLQAGCTVTAVCGSNYDVVSQQGFTMNSVRYGNVKFRPTRKVRSIEDSAGSSFDYVLVCTKSSTEASHLWLSTAIVLIQSGIGIEEEVKQTFSDNAIISAPVRCPATETAPGHIDYQETLNILEVGTYPSNTSIEHRATAKEFAGLMVQGGGGAEYRPDIQVLRCSRLLMGAAWGPIWGIMREIVHLAKAIGVPNLTKEVARDKLSIAMERKKAGAESETRMSQDVQEGRPTEVETVVGTTVRMARQYGVPMPRLETVYALAKGRNATLLAASKDASAAAADVTPPARSSTPAPTNTNASTQTVGRGPLPDG